MAIKVKDLIEKLSKLPQDAEVVAQVNNSGFNGMPGSVNWCTTAEMAENRGYGVWTNVSPGLPGWSDTKPKDVKTVVVLR